MRHRDIKPGLLVLDKAGDLFKVEEQTVDGALVVPVVHFSAHDLKAAPQEAKAG